ncbi:odorant receptor 10-like isoform 2-T2 [Cochliomyia hominivorax]
MYYDLPLFDCNVKIWRYIGFIDFDNFYRTSPILIVVVLTICGQISNFIYAWHDLSVLIMSLFMTAIIMNSLVRIVVVMKNQHKFIKFMKEIENWYYEVEFDGDVAAWSILNNVPKRTGAISKFSLTFGSFGAFLTALVPLVLSHRSHPYAVTIIGLDVLKSPLYEIIYMVQCCVVMPFIVCSYIPFTNLFISWLLFGINILHVLRNKFKRLPSANDSDQLNILKELIKYHKRIIRFGQTLEDLVSFVCLVELVLFTMMLCVLLVCVLLITTVVYIVCILYALFISYWHANEFSSESLKISNAVYNIDWTNSSPEVRKCVLILLVRSQTSLKISAGGMYPMTLEAFQALLNSAYTYFNMLRGLMAK